MIRTCPFCKSENARRSKMRGFEITPRRVFLSPYRCRDCHKRFWVLSRNAQYLAGVVGVTVLICALVWNARALIEVPQPPRPLVTMTEPRLADLLKLADENDAVAEYQLAHIYANGFGVVKSLQDELKWLERAARHGNVEAQYEYGIALRDGHGTVQDYDAARKWMQLAAEGSNAPAQLALGMMYRTGLGIPADNVKAYVWFNVAAAQGVPGANAARDTVLTRLTPAELQDAQAESRRLSAIYIPKAGAAK